MTSRRRSRLVQAAAAGLAVAGAGAGWAAQRRVVTRSLARADEAAGTLALPGDLRHHTVETDDGGRIHAVERGSGPPLVLLHGVTLALATWVHQLQDLADRYRVIAVDQRGHGLSVPGRDGFGAPPGTPPTVGGVRRLSRDLGRVMEALGVDQALLVGHSMGGMVALDYLLDGGRDAERAVAGVALVATSGGPYSRLPGWHRLMEVTGPVSSRGLLLAERIGLAQLPSRDLRWWAGRIAFGPEAPPAEVRFVESMTSATPPATLAGLLPAVAGFDVSRRLGDVPVPALVVVGSHDRLTPPRHARALAAALPRAELVELPRSGHMPMLERRFEFSRLIGEFADKVQAR